MPNPFSNASQLDAPLSQELCQQIHFAALNATATGRWSGDLPERLKLDTIRQLVRNYGRNTLIVHPCEVDALFHGVTLAVYQSIATLYCSRIQRSIPMVWQILNAYAARVGVAPVCYEAVWSIAVYLDDRRGDSIKVTRQYVTELWEIFFVQPHVHIHTYKGDSFNPVIACVADAQNHKFLAFRVTHGDQIVAATTLALYDALVYRRQPTQEVGVGVQWFIPEQIVAPETTANDLTQVCADLEINLTKGSSAVSTLETLRDGWEDDLRDRALSKSRLVAIFDNYLAKMHGHGPIRGYQQSSREKNHLKGYSQDPAAVFPALRKLLPIYKGFIEHGAVALDGLHYQDDLLPFWEGHAVELRRSETSEASAWIYLDGDILCQAMACELRRGDGSYRSRRIGR